MIEYKVIKEYEFWAAGRLWLVPSIRLTVLPDRSIAISEPEIKRVHHAIANVLCGDSTPLSPDEFEFLADITSISLAQIAKICHLERSTLSRWKKTATPMPYIRSLYLKRWFWFKIFAEQLSHSSIDINAMSDDETLLKTVSERALALNIVQPVSKKVAS